MIPLDIKKLVKERFNTIHKIAMRTRGTKQYMTIQFNDLENDGWSRNKEIENYLKQQYNIDSYCTSGSADEFTLRLGVRLY